ncbi:MAG TPA: trypsin-like peptidase domain-containing protein [Myxococcota bacterium]|nr:trypsin-like peptidase domain-containing protein [Myxococcota bacterium]
MRTGRYWKCVGVSALALILAAPLFAKEEKLASPPEPAPISAKERGSYGVVFERVLFRIPAGTPLATTRLRGKVVKQTTWDGDAQDSDAFDVASTDELRRLGYDARDAGDAVFTPDSTVHTRFQIAAIVHAMTLEFDVKPDRRNYGATLSEDSTGRANMEIEFQVFDAVAKKLVSRKRVTAIGSDVGRSPTPMPKALLHGLRLALGDSAFVEPMLMSAATTTAVAQKRKLHRCQAAELSLPSRMPDALAAVVVVAVGSSNGAGALISDDGYVVTAAHIVGDEKSALLRLKLGLELPAEVIFIDSGRDAALLKIPGRGYACLRTASAAPPIGTEIWAIGNPVSEELARSVTRGVVSGNQTVRGRSYLQTDAAVNPGNSGGPLIDSAGAIRGIVVEKIWLPGVEGLGFAIPIDDAERALGIEWE